MRVVYVAGWMRSGTTLLSEMLGAQPRVFSAGEVSGIWSAAARGGLCSCGLELSSCPVWGEALRVASAECSLGKGDYAMLGETTARRFRTRNTWRLLHRSLPDDPEVERLLTATNLLLGSALEIVGADVLVDSSKLLPGLLFHWKTLGTSLQAVHIVRDPRAVAASEQRTSHLSTGNDAFAPPGASAGKSLVRWYGANLSVAAATRALGIPTVTVGYEALVSRPEASMRQLIAALALNYDPSTIVGNQFDAGDTHVAVGNPRRLQAGRRELVVDDRWRTELVGRERWLAEVGSAPARAAWRISRR
jgi:hypothetical protein